MLVLYVGRDDVRVGASLGAHHPCIYSVFAFAEVSSSRSSKRTFEMLRLQTMAFFFYFWVFVSMYNIRMVVSSLQTFEGRLRSAQ